MIDINGLLRRAEALARHVSVHFGREAGLVLMSRILQNLNGFLLSIIIVRRFGLEAAGTLALATTMVALLALLGTFGLMYTFARTDAPLPVKNGIGFTAALVVVPLSLPLLLAFAAMTGRNNEEARVIVLLALAGPYFAQASVVNALQILGGRPAEAIIPPMANFVGLMLAAIIAPDFVRFALILCVCRFLGTYLAFFILPRDGVGLRLFWKHVKEGMVFLTADFINFSTDQLSVFFVSYILDRADLGLFGLCRQMLTVSDTPAWTLMQAKYPGLVAAPRRSLESLRGLMLRLGGIAMVAVVALSVFLGVFVYHSPRFAILAPVLLTSVPLRYLLLLYDAYLRAIGAIMETNRVSLIRAVLAILIIPGGIWLFGVFGGVIGMILHTAIATWLTRKLAESIRRDHHAPAPATRPLAT